jgi:hypothetical protein
MVGREYVVKEPGCVGAVTAGGLPPGPGDTLPVGCTSPLSLVGNAAIVV